MSSRSYTVTEIDALRSACETKWLFGSFRTPEGFRVSRNYTGSEKDIGVEQLVRTYMVAGLTADDLLAPSEG